MRVSFARDGMFHSAPTLTRIYHHCSLLQTLFGVLVGKCTDACITHISLTQLRTDSEGKSPHNQFSSPTSNEVLNTINLIDILGYRSSRRRRPLHSDLVVFRHVHYSAITNTLTNYSPEPFHYRPQSVPYNPSITHPMPSQTSYPRRWPESDQPCNPYP